MSSQSNNSSTVLTVNSEQAARIIRLCRFAQAIARESDIPVRVPVALVGHTGTAKSSIVRQVAMEDGNAYWQASLALLMDSGDFGIPVPDSKAGVMRYFTAGHWPLGNADARGVWSFEELDRCPVEVQRGAAHLMCDGELHGQRVGNGVYMVATMNGVSDTATEELSEHIRTRMVTVFVTRDAAGADDSYDAWAAGKVSVTRRAFNRYARDAMAVGERFEELAVCNSRTADMADVILQASKRVKFRTDDIILPAIAGAIGVGAASRFLAVDKLVAEAPDPELCITRPDTAPVPEEVTTAYALALAIASLVSNEVERERLNGASRYLSRMQPALAAVAFKTVSDANPRIWTAQAAVEWTKENKALLL